MAKMKMKFPIQETVGIIGGSIAAGFVNKIVSDKLPNVPKFVGALLPAALGLFLAGQKNAIVKNAGLGMIAAGGANLAKAFLPGIGAGIDDLIGDPADQSILSLPADQSILAGDDYMGEDFVGEDFVGEEFVGAGDDLLAGEEQMVIMGAEDF
jgi:hypothetical protein